jgi:hypothetical protein
MINIKYYLVLMVGFFLALGLGILIGISLESKDLLENQQSLIVKQIEDEFMQIRNETDLMKRNLVNLQQEKEQLNSLCQILYSHTIKDRLKNLKVSIIKTNKRFDYSILDDLLCQSGASIESNLIINQESLASLNQPEIALNVLKQQISPNKNILQMVAEDLVFSVYHGTSTALIEQLMNKNLLSSLINIEKGCDAIILAGGGQGNMKDEQMHILDVLLIQEALKYDIPIIAVELQQITSSAILKYKELGISTVDNVDSLSGKLALISILDGSFGNFGVKQGAHSLLPAPLFPSSLYSETVDGRE